MLSSLRDAEVVHYDVLHTSAVGADDSAAAVPTSVFPPLAEIHLLPGGGNNLVAKFVGDGDLDVPALPLGRAVSEAD